MDDDIPWTLMGEMNKVDHIFTLHLPTIRIGRANFRISATTNYMKAQVRLQMTIMMHYKRCL